MHIENTCQERYLWIWDFMVICLVDEIRVTMFSLNIVAAVCYGFVWMSLSLCAGFALICQVVASVSRLLQVVRDLIIPHVNPHVVSTNTLLAFAVCLILFVSVSWL